MRAKKEEVRRPMWVGVITLFPEMFSAIRDFGVSGRAIKEKIVTVECLNPRDFTKDRHRTVDDRPYGGGPGMLMKTEPIEAALKEAKTRSGSSPRVIYLTPQGQPLTQNRVKELAREESLVLLCGRYEGVDERLIQAHVDEEISLGDYVLSGGELPAMALIDAVTRLQPEALGDEQSAIQDSFMEGLLDCPHYTRPEQLGEFDGKMDRPDGLDGVNDLKVPAVLLSGDHARIARWRLKQSLGRTWQRRPDLLSKKKLSKEEQALLEEFKRELKKELE